MSSMFTPVTREQNRLRMALDGPSGSGKSYTALRFAFGLAGKDGRVAAIDTEHHKLTKYQGEAPDGIPWQWDGIDLEHFGPATYEQAIKEAGRCGYDVLIIDSLSHAWMGAGGALDQVDRSKSANRFAAWRDVTPQHNALIDSIIRSPCHVIVTLRSKMDYVLEQDEQTGKHSVQKVGLKPIQRDGVEYEFDIVGDMDLDHNLRITKTIFSAIDGKVVNKPNAAFMIPIKEWLLTGVKPKPRPAPVTVVTSTNNSGPRAHEEHIASIKSLCQEIGWTPDRLREVLARKGAQRIADLSHQDAESLVVALQKKALEQDGKETFQ